MLVILPLIISGRRAKVTGFIKEVGGQKDILVSKAEVFIWISASGIVTKPYSSS
jgi:hypothetical protein